MTATLASSVDTLDLPHAEGVSTRAVRAVLRMMAKIANEAGQFRYGLRGSKAQPSVIARIVKCCLRHVGDKDGVGAVEQSLPGGGAASR